MRFTRYLAALSLSCLPATVLAQSDSADPADPADHTLTPEQIVEQAPESVWRSLDPAKTIYMDLPAGTVVIEMRPDFAPKHVARVEKLTREGFYNGLTFHRVIEGFVAQGGDPAGDGTGQSHLPNIEAEFARDTSNVEGFREIGRDRMAPRIGFIDGVPVGAQPEALRTFKTDREVSLWPLHCPRLMSMARATDPNSANSQFFMMIGDARLSLDQRYSVWGMIVDGYEATRRIVRGEPPSRPTPIMRMRMGDEVPAADRKKIEIMSTDSETFLRYLKARGEISEDNAVRDVCDIVVPVRVDGKIER